MQSQLARGTTLSPAEYAAQQNANGTLRRTRVELTQALLRIDGKPVNFVDYPMFEAIYNGGYDKTLLMTCRQVGKSTSISNFQITESVAIPHFKNFFITPTQEQTHKFSTDYVGKTIEYSPLVKKHFMQSGDTKRVLSRSFSNGSKITFSYAMDDADRCRGTPADRLCLDEVQDMVLDAILPVVSECLANSPFQYEMYAGTPKTFENSIQGLWDASSRTEWLIKCDGCNTYNMIRSEAAFGPLGPICQKAGCGRFLNPRNGQWIDTGPRDSDIKGFHISRAIMPLNVPAAWHSQADKDEALRRWKKVYAKLVGRTAYPISKFRNEVIGVSDSVGRRIVTKERLQELCDGPPLALKPTPAALLNVERVTVGVDWSGGGTKIESRTVIWVLGKVRGSLRLRTLYFKIFPGTAPVEEINEIINTIAAWGKMVSLVACDRGEGNAPTDMIRHKIDPRRVIKIAYSDSKKYISWDPQMHGAVVNRTNAIDSLMWALYRGEFQFPKDPEGHLMDTAFKDILSEFEEVTLKGKKIWMHAPTNPDDCLHALNFARIAMQIATKELDLTSRAS